MPAEAAMAGRPMGSLTEAYIGAVEDDPTSILYDARHMKRATAIARHASEHGYDFRDVQCSTCYARWLTREEQWEATGRDRWDDDQLDAYFFGDPERDARWADEAWRHPDGTLIEFAPIPDDPPADWQPRDDDPAWEFCERGADGSIRVYVCEVDG